MAALLRLLVIVQAARASGQRLLGVRQWPESLRAEEGGEAAISCSFNGTGLETVSVEWYRNPTASEAPPEKRYTRQNVTGQGTVAVLTLRALRPNDSGVYACKITPLIPVQLEGAWGNGTRLTVSGASGSRLVAALPWALVPALVLLAAAAALCCSRARRDTGNNIYTEADRGPPARASREPEPEPELEDFGYSVLRFPAGPSSRGTCAAARGGGEPAAARQARAGERHEEVRRRQEDRERRKKRSQKEGPRERLAHTPRRVASSRKRLDCLYISHQPL
nr:PREDICTED: natural cytotoxicity triggering receptor 3-like isoform X2 [Lepisosteus oculatus]